ESPRALRRQEAKAVPAPGKLHPAPNRGLPALLPRAEAARAPPVWGVRKKGAKKAKNPKSRPHRPRSKARPKKPKGRKKKNPPARGGKNTGMATATAITTGSGHPDI